MTNGQMAELLVKRAKEYIAQDPATSIKRNQHMNTYRGPAPDEELSKAVIVDFVNYVMGCAGCDLGLYTKDL